MPRTAFEWLVTEPCPASVEGWRFPGLPRRRVPLDELRDLLLDPELPMATVDPDLGAFGHPPPRRWRTPRRCVLGVALPALFTIAARPVRAVRRRPPTTSRRDP